MARHRASIIADLLIFRTVHVCWCVNIPAFVERRRIALHCDGKLLANSSEREVIEVPYDSRRHVPTPILLPFLVCITIDSYLSRPKPWRKLCECSDPASECL